MPAIGTVISGGAGSAASAGGKRTFQAQPDASTTKRRGAITGLACPASGIGAASQQRRARFASLPGGGALRVRLQARLPRVSP
jgi:hypothetical protein